MPRIPIDYSKTLIYKLVHTEDYDNSNVYVGCTTDFRRRKTSHKHSCNNEKNRCYNQKKYQYIRDNGGWDNWNMIEIEKYPCNDKREAEAREVYWQSYFNSQLNMRKSYITDEQNKDRISRQKKVHYENNKEQKKLYYENNKEQKQEYYKIYYENNKEKIECDCGCTIIKSNLKQHLKTKKHTNF
jgi:hypothetical protein